MTALTANTLFHFTGSDSNKDKNALLNGLGAGFRPSYCLEFGDEAIKGVIKDMQIAMVCFCDLPLSKLEKHIDRYGQYGLGMNKEWGMENRLNPVTYVNRHSFLLSAAGIIVNQLVELFREYLQKVDEQKLKGTFAYSSEIGITEDGQLQVKAPPGIPLSFPSNEARSFRKA